MIRSAVALVLVLVSAGAAWAEGSLSAETLAKLKKATAFIRIDVGRESVSGSGFLLGKIGESGYVATNSHVIAASRGGAIPIKVIFSAGTKEETEFTAEVAGDDPNRDLALLKIKSDKLPAIISSSKAVELTETMQVYVLGFPFGEALATSGRNPAITVSKGEVSSIRRGIGERIAAIQIDGGINPGNSGGPVVSSDGDLIGISVAKVRGTEIGFAIPTFELREMLLGRLAAVQLTETSRTKDWVTFSVSGRVIDPLQRMHKVTLLAIAKSRVTSEPKPSEEGVWSKIAEAAKSFEMKLEGQEFHGEIKLAPGKAADTLYWFQPTYVRSDSKLVYSQPSEFVVKGNAPGTLASSSRPPSGTKPGGAAKTKGASADDWLGKSASGASPADDDPLFGKVSATPKTMNESLGGTRKLVEGSDDIFMTPLNLQPEKLLKTVVYSGDGKHAYLATTDGILRKVTVPELVEVARLEVGNCGALAMSKAGLVAALSATQRLLLLDKDSLAIKSQIRVSGPTWVTASPQTNIAFVCSGGRSRSLTIVDLGRGAVVSQVEAGSLGKPAVASSKPGGSLPLSDFSFPTLTPDGKYLFVCSWESLHRIAVKGTSLTLEETGPRIGQNAQGMEISIDSKYVALPSGGGNYSVEGHPPVGYGTYIYSVADLQSPRIGIKTGAYPRVIALDPVAKLIYAQNHDTQLIVLNTAGVEEGKYNLLPGRNDSLEFALHPAGKKMFVILENGVLWVELTRK
jgi:hypothetical protein